MARFQRGGHKDPASPMPWDGFSRKTAHDAGALYEFLWSLPPAGLATPEEPTVRR